MPPYTRRKLPKAVEMDSGSLGTPLFCGRHADPTQNPLPAAGHLTLDPEFACDHAPLIRFARRPLLGVERQPVCPARFILRRTRMYCAAPVCIALYAKFPY